MRTLGFPFLSEPNIIWQKTNRTEVFEWAHWLRFNLISKKKSLQGIREVVKQN